MLDEKILKILRSDPDTYISGEELCKIAGISRAAIWKHMEKLRGEGYDIEASPHLGYRLAGIPDSLIPQEIKWGLKAKVIGREIISYEKVDSTNTVAYGLAEKGMKEGAVIFAEEQSAGKGRHGRVWLSPPKGGIYMSCILRPKITPNEIPRITLLAAVAVAKAVRKTTGLEAMIKWPNDILANDRKICGILTEMKAEQDSVDFIILGIGINVNSKPRSAPKGASSIRDELASGGRLEKVSRVALARAVIETIEEEYMRLKKYGFEPIIDEWKQLSAMLGSRVKLVLSNRTVEGIAHDIDTDGALIIRVDAGVLEKFSSGDIVVAR